MATLRSIAERRARAMARINRVSTALAEKFKIEAPDLPERGRDPELLRAAQLETMADLLENVAIATKAITREEIMNNVGTTAEGQGPARPNEEGFDTQLPEGAKAASAEAEAQQDTGPEDLNELTVEELKDRARDAEISGFSAMNKAELVKAIKKAEK